MRQRLAAVTVLAALAGVGAASPARAAGGEFQVIVHDGVILMHERVTVAAAPVRGAGTTRSDFDGDGVDDIAAAGQPMDYELPHPPTGVVTVRYSSAPYVDHLLGAHDGGGCACFGTALASGDIDGDGYDDLVIGDQDEVDPVNEAHAGGVWVLPGSATGLRVDAAQHVNQSSLGVPGAAENLDRFGNALAVGDLNGDGRDDLAVGAFGESIGSVPDAGAVTVLFGGSGGLTTAGAQSFNQDQAAVPGAAERNDQFGGSVAIGRVNADRFADLVIAAPLENDTQSFEGTGMVTLLRGSAAGVSTTGATAVTGAQVYAAVNGGDRVPWSIGMTTVVGDVNGDGLGEVVAGAPGAQGPEINAGAVVVLAGRSTGLSATGARMITQDTAGVPGVTEDQDGFGAALAAGDVTGDGRADVLVAAPGEAIGSAAEAGSVVLLKGSPAGLTGAGSVAYDQNTAGVPDAAEQGDEYGNSVALLNLDGVGGWDAAVAAPGEEVAGDTPGYGTGLISTLHGGPSGLSPQADSWSGRSLRTDRLLPMGYGQRVAGPQSGGPL